MWRFGGRLVPSLSLATGEGDHAQHGGGGEFKRLQPGIRPLHRLRRSPLPRCAGEEPAASSHMREFCPQGDATSGSLSSVGNPGCAYFVLRPTLDRPVSTSLIAGFAKGGRMKSAAAVAMLLFLTAAEPAFAEAEACVDPATKQVNAEATQAWQQMAGRSDPELMRQMAGTWYFENPNPYTTQVDHQYQCYSADGLFDYQESRVCDTASGACNDYAGQGNYAVIAMGDGSMQFMTIVSDLNRDRAALQWQRRPLHRRQHAAAFDRTGHAAHTIRNRDGNVGARNERVVWLNRNHAGTRGANPVRD